MWPGEVCWIVDVTIRASDDFELGDDAKKRARLYVRDFVLKLQRSSRGLNFRLAGDRIADLLIHRVRGGSVENAPF